MSGITSSSDGREKRALAGLNQAGSADNRDWHAVEPWIGQCVVRIDALSRREQDVLRLLGRGLENRAIATTLGIAERTVKQHVTRILTKLGCQSRLQAGLVAFAAHSVISVQLGMPLSPPL
jgi:DNA-binding NarL/FixJ family response regulator